MQSGQEGSEPTRQCEKYGGSFFVDSFRLFSFLLAGQPPFLFGRSVGKGVAGFSA